MIPDEYDEDPDSRYWTCDVCGWIVMAEDQHFPHDKDCVDREDCECDNITCEGCCWECNGEVELGSQDDYTTKPI